MDKILDDNFLEEKAVEEVVYGKFWARAIALFIDGIIISIVSVPLTMYNLIEWKSGPLYLVGILVSVLYKPFMEWRYGATLGKMARGLKVVDYDYKKASLAQVLLRNIFGFIGAIIGLVFILPLFYTDALKSIENFQQYILFLGTQKTMSAISNWSNLIYVIELIMLVTDSRSRSLHDRIGKTYVIKESKIV